MLSQDILNNLIQYNPHIPYINRDFFRHSLIIELCSLKLQEEEVDENMEYEYEKCDVQNNEEYVCSYCIYNNNVHDESQCTCDYYNKYSFNALENIKFSLMDRINICEKWILKLKK
jgi:hypothetical protein